MWETDHEKAKEMQRKGLVTIIETKEVEVPEEYKNLVNETGDISGVARKTRKRVTG